MLKSIVFFSTMNLYQMIPLSYIIEFGAFVMNKVNRRKMTMCFQESKARSLLQFANNDPSR